MRKIFVLKGVSNTGKTTKINTIADWIINKYGIPNTIGLNQNNLKEDTLGIMIINNLTIGFNSSGDTLSEVKKIEKLKEEDYPDIILCACRTRGKGLKFLKNTFNYSNGWLPVYLKIDEFSKVDIVNQSKRDLQILDDLQTWLIGLEK